MTVNVQFEKIVGGGKALGYLDGRACFAAGPLPGEVAEVDVFKRKPEFVEARVVQITKAAPERNGESEPHFLACAPWQGVVRERQLELKRQVLEEAFGRQDLAVSEMVGADQVMGYRNKLEFSLKNEAGQIRLAFHARGSYDQLVALPEGCRLGSDAMNLAALALAQKVQELRLAGFIETLTVRQSAAHGTVMGIVAMHQVPKKRWSDLMVPGLGGLVVARVRRRDEYELVWHEGATELVESIGGLELAYPYDSFFQTNPAMFERAQRQILAQVPAGGKLVDLYGGVGSIGLAAAASVREVVGVEINPSSTRWAVANADRNGIRNYTAQTVAAERLDMGLLRSADCVILDPPRAGLHARVIDALLEARPSRIIYLSCDPVTQARDVRLLAAAYRAGSIAGFDFYPGTLHLESLVALDRI